MLKMENIKGIEKKGKDKVKWIYPSGAVYEG